MVPDSLQCIYPWTDRLGEVTDVILGEGVTVVGVGIFSAFYSDGFNLRSVQLPSTLTFIDQCFIGLRDNNTITPHLSHMPILVLPASLQQVAFNFLDYAVPTHLIFDKIA